MTLLVALVVALPVLALGEVAAADARDRSHRAELRAGDDAAHRIGDLVAAQFKAISAQVVNTISNVSVKAAMSAGTGTSWTDERDRQRLASLLRDLKTVFGRDVIRLFALEYTAEARLIAQAPYDDLQVGSPYGQKEYIEYYIEHKGLPPFYFSKAYISPVSLEPAVAIVAGVYGQGLFQAQMGYVVAEVDLTRVPTWLAPVASTVEDAYIIDGEGRVVASLNEWSEPLAKATSSDAIAKGLQGQFGTEIGRGLEGSDDRFVSSSSFRVAPPTTAGNETFGNHWNWFVLSTRTRGDTEQQLEAALSQGAALRGVVIFVLLIATYFLALAASRVSHQRGQLAIANAELARLTKAKSEFLANMSHELRTPLNAILGFSDVLLQKIFGDVNQKQEEYLRDVNTSGRHLLDLINDILDLSKVEAGKYELDRSTFSLADSLSSATAMVRERAARHGVTLALVMNENVANITADERKVRQIVLNLLTNAIKFTPEGGSVQLSATVDGDHARVSVRDTGVGIAPEDLDRIFEEFQQAKHGRKVEESTGLGLTLSKRFVELHGGRMWVESESGRGSTFFFTLPLAGAVLETARAPTSAR